ncbi:hypothetical protein [Halorussus pelagicus]|uniref:hypothetical protein n=1 Tax=Halorussus pelagicus TaxID=2505977 RepID=UPI000FFB35EC|nr:hypothetical protein [Halorussus pelagicus]
MISDVAKQTAQEAVETYEQDIVPQAWENLDEGRSCTVCEGDEYATLEGKAECTVQEYTGDCGCGGQALIHRLTVNIGGKLPFSQKHLLKTACTECDDLAEVTVSDILKFTSPVQEETFHIETGVFTETHPIHHHHTSYTPEETILVCDSCHARIHSDPDFRPDLTPSRSRDALEADSHD